MKFLTVVISGLLSWMTSCVWAIVFSLQMRTGSELDDETCATFVLHEEDHTLGNSLRYIIMKKYDTLIGEFGSGGGERLIRLRTPLSPCY